jgi:hypothetical protein
LETKRDLRNPCEIFVFRCPAKLRPLAGALVRKPAQSLGFDASVVRDQVEKTHPATHDDGALWLHRQPAAAGELI